MRLFPRLAGIGAFLAAAALPLGFSAPAHAQTFVSNTGRSTVGHTACVRGSNPVIKLDCAQGFETGQNTRGYRLSSIHMAVSLEPAGIDGMVGGCAEMFAGVPEVDRLRLGREALQKGPVVGGSIGDGGDGDIGAHLPDKGAVALGLSGPVNPDAFQAVLEGRVPDEPQLNSCRCAPQCNAWRQC